MHIHESIAVEDFIYLTLIFYLVAFYEELFYANISNNFLN